MKNKTEKDKFDYDEEDEDLKESGDETKGYARKKPVDKKQGDGLEEFLNDSDEKKYDKE